MKYSILGMWKFYKRVGWRGVVCELFNIVSKHNEMYQNAFLDGVGAIYDNGNPLLLNKIICHLASDIPDIEPFRTRAVCQILGFSDAKNHLRCLASGRPRGTWRIDVG